MVVLAQGGKKEDTSLFYLRPYNSVLSGFEQIKLLKEFKVRDISVDLVLEIVRRESNFDPTICNGQFGCRSGIGLFQIVIETLKHCQKQLGRELNARDAEDNVDCGIWLLKNEGIKPWQPYSGPYDLQITK